MLETTDGNTIAYLFRKKESVTRGHHTFSPRWGKNFSSGGKRCTLVFCLHGLIG